MTKRTDGFRRPMATTTHAWHRSRPSTILTTCSASTRTSGHKRDRQAGVRSTDGTGSADLQLCLFRGGWPAPAAPDEKPRRPWWLSTDHATIWRDLADRRSVPTRCAPATDTVGQPRDVQLRLRQRG